MNASGEFVFAPLGGVGEIGMNLSIYGLGPERSRTWIAVDFDSPRGANEAVDDHVKAGTRSVGGAQR